MWNAKAHCLPPKLNINEWYVPLLIKGELDQSLNTKSISE